MDVISRINSSGWHDCFFDSLNVDCDKVIVKISYEGNHYHLNGTVNENHSDVHVSIHCNNHIGVLFIGQWDESVIESIRIETEGDSIDSSLLTMKRLSGEPPMLSPGVGLRKTDNTLHQLNIKLIDGVVIKIVCEDFMMEIGEANTENNDYG